MRRIYFPLIPVFIAAVALTLGSTPVGAQQEHDHGAAAASGAGCACCQKSGSDTINHAAAKTVAPAQDPVDGDPVDHAALGHVATPGAGGCCASMQHEAGGGCCAGMAMNHGAAATDAAKTEGAGCACCANMAAHSTAPTDHSEHGAAPDASTFAMPGKAGCGAMNTTANTAIDPFAEDPSVTE